MPLDRNRSNEDRELAKQLGSSTESFGEFAQKTASMLDSLESRIAEQTTDQTSQRLAACLAEVDHSVSHAIARSVAIETADARNAIEDSLKGKMSSSMSNNSSNGSGTIFAVRLVVPDSRCNRLADAAVRIWNCWSMRRDTAIVWLIAMQKRVHDRTWNRCGVLPRKLRCSHPVASRMFVLN